MCKPLAARMKPATSGFVKECLDLLAIAVCVLILRMSHAVIVINV